MHLPLIRFRSQVRHFRVQLLHSRGVMGVHYSVATNRLCIQFVTLATDSTSVWRDDCLIDVEGVQRGSVFSVPVAMAR